MKPLVYIASPYTCGDVGMNVRSQMVVFDNLWRTGVVLPFAPLLSHFQHIAFPHPYDDWLEYDLALIRRGVFQACYRCWAQGPGYVQVASTGADREVEEFRRMGLPTFAGLSDLLNWARGISVGGDSPVADFADPPAER